jgi:hypothetical protein
MNPDFSQIAPFLFAALVVFGIYRRFRRSFGQQLLRPRAMYVRIGLLVLVGCLLVPSAARSYTFAGASLAGVAVGIALALWGAARTRFVWVADRLYYVPHTYTGIVVSLLFVGRLVYRLIQVYTAMHTAGGMRAVSAADQPLSSASMLKSPLTVGLFFVLMGYYVCYYIIVLRKSKLVPAAGAEAVGA